MSDHSLQDDLKACDAGQIPSPFGEMELVVLGSPASVQSTKHVKDTYLASIKAQIAQFKFLLTGELMLDVIWLLPAKS